MLDQVSAEIPGQKLYDLDLDSVKELVKGELKPIVREIDTEHVYPVDIMHSLGNFGAYSGHLSKANSSGNINALDSIKAMSAVSEVCMSTGFCVWCHDACGWYLENTENKS